MFKNTTSRSISELETPLNEAFDGCVAELTKTPGSGAADENKRHRHPCLHCRAVALCPQAYGERCPLPPSQNADCRDDIYAQKESDES